jgi:hypothetical protein
MNHGTDHPPQPLEPEGEKPGRFVARVDDCVAHLRSHCRIGQCHGVSHTVADFLDGPQANGQGAQLLDTPLQHPSAVPRITLPGINLSDSSLAAIPNCRYLPLIDIVFSIPAMLCSHWAFSEG